MTSQLSITKEDILANKHFILRHVKIRYADTFDSTDAIAQLVRFPFPESSNILQKVNEINPILFQTCEFLK